MDGCIHWACLRRVLVGMSLLTFASTVSAVEPKISAAVVQAPLRVASLSFISPDGTRQPVVEIWSNGLVKATEVRGTRQNPVLATLSDRLSAVELKELHELLIGSCRLGTQTTEGIHESLQIASEQRQLTADIDGASATEIGILTGNRWHTVTCPAVSILTQRFPDVVEVQNVSSAQSMLQNIAAVALIGGGDAADLHAATATHKLREMHPEAGEITRRDLQLVRRLPNGNRFVQFHYVGSPGQNDGCLVCVTQSPEGPTRVSLMDSPTVVR